MSPDYPQSSAEPSAGSEEIFPGLSPIAHGDKDSDPNPDCGQWDSSESSSACHPNVNDGDCQEESVQDEIYDLNHEARLDLDISACDIADLLNTRNLISPHELAELHQLAQLPDQLIDFPPIGDDEEDWASRAETDDSETMPAMSRQMLQDVARRLRQSRPSQAAETEAEHDDEELDAALVEAENAAYWEWYIDRCRALGDINFQRLPDI